MNRFLCVIMCLLLVGFFLAEKTYNNDLIVTTCSLYLTFFESSSNRDALITKGIKNKEFILEGQFSEKMEDFAYKFDVLKKEAKIKIKMIIRKGRKEHDSKTFEYKYLPNIDESPAVTNIYGDKIAIIIWTDEPEAVIIENDLVAKAYKSYFDILWKIAKN